MASPARTPTTKHAVLASSLFWVLGLGSACDGNQRPRDIAAPAGVPTSEVAIRIDAPSHGAPSASVLAFRAELSGIEPGQVLAAVDPLMVAPPVTGCTLQAVDEVSNRLRSRSGWVDLQSLGDVQVDLGEPNGLLRVAPSVYPDLATVVSGVVGEAGPTDLATIPDRLRVRVARDTELEVAVPPFGNVKTADGVDIQAGRALPVRGDLELHVQGPSGTFIEIRPFGATLWAACAATPVPGGDHATVTVPAAILQKLARLSGEVPVSFDVVWRNVAQLGPAAATVSLPARVSLETRTSALVELVP